jgi:hypothetical protein
MLDELKAFAEKVTKVEKNECGRGQMILNSWFVSNTERLEEGVQTYANTKRIKLMKAQLPNNWERRSDYSINNIEEI